MIGSSFPLLWLILLNDSRVIVLRCDCCRGCWLAAIVKIRACDASKKAEPDPQFAFLEDDGEETVRRTMYEGGKRLIFAASPQVNGFCRNPPRAPLWGLLSSHRIPGETSTSSRYFQATTLR